MSFVKKKGLKEELVTKTDPQDIKYKNITNSVISNSKLQDVELENCTITNTKNNLIRCFNNLEDAEKETDIIKVGEIIYVNDLQKLFQTDLVKDKKAFIELLKKIPPVTLKASDTSGQYITANAENVLLFSNIDYKTDNIELQGNNVVNIEKTGVYLLTANFTVNNVVKEDTLSKFAIKNKNKEKTDITNFFVKQDNIGYLSGKFEGIFEKGTSFSLVLDINGNEDKYLDIKKGTNYLNITLLEEL